MDFFGTIRYSKTTNKSESRKPCRRALQLSSRPTIFNTACRRRYAQAHKISERVHDINLLGMNAETVGKVR